jgi:hypothetical protein
MIKVYKGIFLICMFSTLLASNANAQSNQWTWMKGDNTLNQFGVYGTQGTAAAANKPGSRSEGVSWTDGSQNLWLFGGLSYAASGSVLFNDLWKYNPLTNVWTWVKGDSTTDQAGVYGIKGTAAAANKPGARMGSVSWTDGSGDLWLFGGYAPGFGSLNDLWKYNTSSNQWTWVKGDSTINQPGVYGTQGTSAAANTPGARRFGVS